MVDWSGGNDRGARPTKDAIWACIGAAGTTSDPVYLRNRQVAEAWIIQTLTGLRAAGHRVLVGFDLCFAYPKGFATQLVGSEDPLALWDWFAARVTDSPVANNRFDLAGQINARLPGTGPFWFNALQRDIPHLPRKGTDRTGHGLPEKRTADLAVKGSFSPWQLAGAGAVGGQVIMGFPTLARLRRRFDGDLAVWPFQPPDAQIVLAETYFSLLPDLNTPKLHPIKDAAQVMLYARAFSGLAPADMAQLMAIDATPEGWVLGAGAESVLRAAATRDVPPPPLRNDCFAMPQGAHWTPVDTALDHLRTQLGPVTGQEDMPIALSAGRILAQEVTARRSHPPAPNAAVDGYGFAGPAPVGVNRLPLVAGRAAAGQPYGGTVPPGHAIRILTGANLPDGVDTVVLQEDVTTTDTSVAFHGPLKQGANARRAGEDMTAGEMILPAGRKLTPADLATITAAGVGVVTVQKRLRVGVLSTGDELRDAGEPATVGQIFDANRPMLCAVAAGWGYDVVDLGRAPDDRPTLRQILDDSAPHCDVILTSGGASAGDEDHMSALLSGTGSLALWRIAMKPGRPLALGLWRGTPVFGLPGNPVAAMVCAMIFARPALQVMAGGGWPSPEGYLLPADFTKFKKAGRREYLRARIVDGRVHLFASEGSGRVSGLSWATGLVELDDAAQEITAGDLVRFIPFGSFAH
ncbi:gephyrin-like molybdotransferase Glp [Yoonia sp.]|uniref:molybdenum cofactor synthesis domain-containing protein n=1 Tax=Yoonia sp. TaxID=2212373 RepID=UPI0019E6D1A6|nr:gephyrin-like molybdotransferase Glp [Yoonia sp.]MBE0412385.1 molybdopterin molybdenumtransferase MoeA [Yoonia sp.]